MEVLVAVDATAAVVAVGFDRAGGSRRDLTVAVVVVTVQVLSLIHI